MERDASTAGIDTLYVTFSEPVRTASLNGKALILIKNGVPSELTITNADSISSTRFKLTVSSTISPPQLGDSLRIDPTGPIADVFGNTANTLNRPVVITQKPIPAAIVQAYYLDKNADGVVDAVRIIFKKSVSLNDLAISLTWGDLTPAYADSIPTGRLSYFGADSLGIEINDTGAFKTISADSIKTSGHMQATVSFNSMPENPAEAADVADSAAPVIVSANYLPGLIGSGSSTTTDTLSIVFSEPIATITSNTPFQLENKSTGLYMISLVLPSLPGSGNTLRFLVPQTPTMVYPQKGDSIWINPGAGVGDAGSIIQTNPNNRRAVLQVAPIPYQPPPVTIVKCPFSIGSPVSDAGVSGTGTIIEVTPLKQLAGLISFSATLKIFDVLGNTVLNEVALKQNPLSNQLYYLWDGQNQNGRYVGAGAYVTVTTVMDSNGKVFTKKLTIGVKR